MIYIILSLLLVAAMAAAWLFAKAGAKARASARTAWAETDKLKAALKAAEGINREATQRLAALGAGTDAERFSASLDVLHDIASGGKPAAGGVADLPGPAGKG